MDDHVNNEFTILVVDDSAFQRHFIEEKLNLLGYQVVTAHDGLDALAKVGIAPPDLVLLDVEMPRMGGFELASRLKNDKKTGHIPIIFLTSHEDDEHLAQGLEVGGDDFFIKPTNLRLLGIRIGVLLKVKKYNDHLIRHQALLESEVSQKTQELQRALKDVENLSLDTISRLAQAGEFRDDITGNHVARIGQYSSIMARAMGMPEKMADAMLLAATMHDIGKIGIPDSILLKPGPLDDAEWEIMREHPAIGAEILGDSTHECLGLAIKIALSHHERWDGNGYPSRLKEDSIPLAGRIVAVVDSFDAMTTKRPYREPMPTEQAVKIISAEAGRQFDPLVVEVFLSIIDEVANVQDIYLDT